MDGENAVGSVHGPSIERKGFVPSQDQESARVDAFENTPEKLDLEIAVEVCEDQIPAHDEVEWTVGHDLADVLLDKRYRLLEAVL